MMKTENSGTKGVNGDRAMDDLFDTPVFSDEVPSMKVRPGGTHEKGAEHHLSYGRSRWSRYLAGTSLAFPAQLPRR